MTTFINVRFSRRDPNCTNVVACVAPAAPNENFAPAADDVLIGLDRLHRVGETVFYGYL